MLALARCLYGWIMLTSTKACGVIATYEASTDNVELILVVIMANSVYQAFIFSVSSLVQLPYFIIITILYYIIIPQL